MKLGFVYLTRKRFLSASRGRNPVDSLLTGPQHYRIYKTREAVAKLPHPGKSMILTSIARTGSPVRSDEIIPRREAESERMQWAAKGRFSCGGAFCNCLKDLKK